MQLPVNTELQNGKYLIQQTLAQGGFGITYLAIHTVLKRKVAIKEFFIKEYCDRNSDSQVSLGTAGSRDMVERFRAKFIKEAQTIAALEHSNIIRIFDIFEENGTAYYVMEYHEAGSIADYLKTYRRMSESEAVRLIKQVAGSLDYLHKRNMNHLDIKPANILLNAQNDAVLIDFGLSKNYDAHGNQTSTTPIGISHGYAPLEQYRAGGVGSFSPQTDIYSLGATLYKMLTGVTPPEAVTISLEGVPEMPNDISDSSKRAIIKAMSPMRNDRPADVAEFISLLNDAPNIVEKVETSQERTIIFAEPNKSDESTHLVGEENDKTNIADTVNPNQQPSKQNSGQRKNKIVVALFVMLGIIVGAVAWQIFDKQKSETDVAESEDEIQNQDLSREEMYKKALDAQDAEEYEEAFKWFYKLAEMGDAEAQTIIGVYYYYALGVEEDNYEAFRWFSKADAQGYEDPDLYFALGECYYLALGVEENDEKAFEYFSKSEKLGDCASEDKLYGYLTECYYNGFGVTKNYALAAKWARKGVELDDANSQNYLGLMYYDGKGGVSQNYYQAVRYFRLAANQELAAGQYNLGMCYYYGDGVEEDESEAVKWFKSSAELGYESAKEALDELGIEY